MALLANQRPIADVNVEFVSSEHVKRVEDITFKEVYSQILAKPEISVSLRASISVDAIRNTSQSASSSPEAQFPKHTMVGNPLTNTYSLSLIDRVMICTPIAPYFNVYPTRFMTTTELKNGATGAEAFTTASSSVGMSVMPKALYPDSENAYGWTVNTWSPTSSAYNSVFHTYDFPFITKCSLVGSFIGTNSQLVSANLLKKNQPFAVNLKIGAFSEAQIGYLDQFASEGINFDDPDVAHTLVGKYGPVSDVASKYNSNGFSGLSSDEKTALYDFFNLDKTASEATLEAQVSSKVDEFEKSDQKKPNQVDTIQRSSTRVRVPAIDINWGGYTFTVYKDGQLRLSQEGKQLGPLQNLDINATDENMLEVKLIIYPIGTCIYVLKGDMTSDRVLTNRVASFDLVSPVMIPESPVMVTFRCGSGAFAFSPVVHPYSGELVSPPMGVSEAPDSTVVNVHYVGKFGVGSRGTGTIEFPDSNDKEKTYEYLKGCKIEYELLNMNNGSYLYKIKLSPNIVPTIGGTEQEFLAQAINSIYSPAVYMSQIFLLQNLETINYNPSPDIDNCDLLSIGVNQAVEGSSASITLNNRRDLANCQFASGGKYTHREGRDTFTGIKPIKIELGYNSQLYRVFTGYVTNYRYVRSGVAQSTVELTCEDRSKKLKEQYAVNLPFFDGWCLGGDSKILTTNGLETIKQLYQKGHNFDIVTSYEDGTKVIVKDCIPKYSGMKKLYKIKLNNGLELKSTLDHKFLKFNTNKAPYACTFYKSYWSKLEDLKVGDKIKVNGGTGRDLVLDKNENVNIDELLGWLVGDGFYNFDLNWKAKHSSAGMVFGKYDYQALRHLFPIWKKLLISLECKVPKPTCDDSKTITFMSGNMNLFKYLVTKGFIPAMARDKKLPEYIWTAGTKQQCAFLRGLFSADGTVYGGHDKACRVSLATNSKQLALDVQNLLLSLGITSNIIDKPYSKYKTQKNRKNPRQDGFALDICGEASIRYMKYIGFILDRKIEKWCPPQVPNKKKDFQEIVSIELVGEEDVYDITMSEVHAFYANGVYAHNCHIAAMYYLARYAGLDDDEFYLYQNPVTGQGTTIASLLTGNSQIMQGGCFEGHVNQSLTPNQQGISSDYLHMRLPMALIMAGDSPNYAFQMGTPIWSCMEEIRSFTNWYMYFNNWGNLVYGPPKLIVDNINQTFKEVADCGDFNEITRNMNVEYNTADTRNYVFLQGLTWLGPKIGTPGGEKGQWSPHISVGAKEGWPNDQTDFAHCPWRRAAFMRNPKWEDVRLLQLAASEMLRRSIRYRGVENFESWGHPELFPYHVITIDESGRDETGVDGMDVVIAAHNLSINASDLLLTSQFSCETLDQTAIDYDPNLPPNKRE